MSRSRSIAAASALSLATLVGAGGFAAAAPIDTTIAPAPLVVDDDDVEPAGPSDTAPVGTEPQPPTSAPTTDAPDDGDQQEVDDPASIPTDVVPPVRASVRTSDIPRGSIVLAVLVLAGVGGLSYVLARRRDPHTPLDDRVATGPVPPAGASDSRTDPASARSPTADTATLEFLLELGEALVDAGDAVSHVEATLRTVASVNGIHDVGVLVFPTALIVSVPNREGVSTEVSIAGTAALRLDQVDDVLQLVHDAERGDVDPPTGRRRLHEIRTSPPPSATWLLIVGHVLSTVGLALILHAGWREVLLAAALGAVVGAFRLATRSLGSPAQPFLPLVAAALVSVSVFTAMRIVDDLIAFPVIVAPLITFLPGALLTIGVLELATGQIIAGSARIASGGMRLVLLAIGIVAGVELVGAPATDLRGTSDGQLATLAPWVGVAVFGVGVAWFNSARGPAMRWILVVLYVAYSGQVIGGLFFGSALSAFFGALAMTPVAVLAARQRSGPTPLVTFLPGFWILVPGALGLEGVSRLLSDSGVTGSGALVTTLTSMVGISLGILLGLTIVAADPTRPWAEARVQTGIIDRVTTGRRRGD